MVSPVRVYMRLVATPMLLAASDVTKLLVVCDCGACLWVLLGGRQP